MLLFLSDVSVLQLNIRFEWFIGGQIDCARLRVNKQRCNIFQVSDRVEWRSFFEHIVIRVQPSRRKQHPGNQQMRAMRERDLKENI